MKKRNLIHCIVILHLVFIVGGCDNKTNFAGKFKAYGEGGYWTVASYYEVSEEGFSEYAVLTFIGEGNVADGEYVWK